MAQDIVIGGRLHSAATGNTVSGANEILDDAKGKKQNVINQEVDNEIGSDSAAGTIKGRIKNLETAVGSGGSVDERIAETKAEIIGDAAADYNTLGKVEDKIQETKSEILGDAASDYNTLGKVEDKIQAETSRAEAAEGALDNAKANKATTLEGYGITDAYTKSETYNKTEVNGLVETPHQNYVTVLTYAALIAIDPGSTDTIYRVSNYDGSVPQVDVTKYSEYAWDGTQYVFLCVKSQIDEVFDISVYNNNATYADLAAAIGTDGANVPQTLRRGGMSVKYVQTSDNKYVQFRCKTQSFSANTEDWAFEGDDTLVENPEYIKAITDAEGHLLGWIRKSDGGIDWAVGVPKPVKNYVDTKVAEIWNGNEGTQIDGLNKVINFLQDFVTTSNLMQYLNETYGEYIQNPEFVYLWTNNDNKIIIAIQNDGNVLFGAGVPKQIIRYIAETIKIDGKSVVEYLNETYGEYTKSPEFVRVLTDKDGKIILAVKNDSDVLFGFGCPTQIQEFVENYINTNDNSIRKYLDATFGLYVEDPEGRMEIRTDNTNKIISYRDEDGRLHEEIGITTNSLHLSQSGMTEFQQALKDAGFTPGGGGDYSDAITEKGKKPVFIPTPRLAMVNIIWDGNLSNLSKSDRPDGVQKVNYDVKVPVEFFDGQGVYFKKYALMSAQGNSSMGFIKKNISLKFFDTEDVEGKKKKWGKGDTFGTVFGNWVMQKTYHLKAFYTDFVRGSSEVAYQLADEVYKTRGVYADRPWKKALIDFSKINSCTPAGLSEDGINDMNLQIDDGARCMPDGFPVIVYQNGEFYGIYVWMLKKDADNFNMDTSNIKHIHIDGVIDVQRLWGGNIDWTMFEIRNPEDLVCMDGNDYDGDFPAELIDATSENYDSSNKNHVRSAQVKQYIIDLSHRVGEINSLTPTYTRPDETIITLNSFKGSYNIDASYERGNYVIEQQDVTRYYMSLHYANTGHDLSDTEYWHDITEDISSVKSEIEKYFDVDNLVDYQLINMACGDTDGFGKNWQWTTWDGIKWYVNQYDKDMAFGNHFAGMYTRPVYSGWYGNNINLPSGLAIRYYTPEHKTRWQGLVGAGIINAEHIKNLVTAWISRIGKYNYVQEWKKWPESPCNRDSCIDFENWDFDNAVRQYDYPEGMFWDESVQYNIDDTVWFSFTTEFYARFKAKKSNINKCPLTDRYSRHPVNMGYRDSAWRFYKYIEETISNQNVFINSL